MLQKCHKEKDDDPKEFTDIVGHGRWQVRIIALLAIASVIRAGNHLGATFLAFPKDYWCVRPYFSNETGVGRPRNDTGPVSLPPSTRCEMYSMNRSVEGEAFVTTTRCEEWAFEPGYKSIIEEWNLVCQDDWLISTSQSIYMIGFLFAVFISGQMSDMYGRRPTILILIGVLLTAGFAASCAPSFVIFVVSRFFVAIGHSGMHLAAFVLLAEVVGSTYRAPTLLVCSFGWSLGCVLIPAVAWLLQSCFYFQLAVTAPSLLFLSFYWLVPESPRWLLSTNKLKKAIEVMEKAAIANRKHVTDLKAQATTLYIQAFKNKGNETNVTVVDLMRTPNLRKKTLSLYFIWMSIAFTFYGLSLNTSDLHGDVFWNFFFSGLMEIPATIFCMLTIDRWGRKKPFFGTLTVGGVVCLSCIFMKEDWWQMTPTLAMCGKLCVSASFTIVYVYTAEIFPTVARNVGVGSCSTVARIGSAVAPFMRDLVKVTNRGVPLAIFGILSLISGILVVFLPETMNHPVPETLNQAEEFGKFYKKTAEDSELKGPLQPLME